MGHLCPTFSSGAQPEKGFSHHHSFTSAHPTNTRFEDRDVLLWVAKPEGDASQVFQRLMAMVAYKPTGPAE